MTTHDWARELEAAAAILRKAPAVDVGFVNITSRAFFGSDKEKFIEVIKAVKPGIKEYDEFELTFTPREAPRLHVLINRNVVCRKVREAEYECEPLLSPEEDALLGAVQS